MNFTWLCLVALLGVATAAKRIRRQLGYYPRPYYGPHAPLPLPYHPIPTYDQVGHPPLPAVCRLIPAVDSPVRGEIVLHQASPYEPVLLTGTVLGLTPGLHGFHVHQTGNVSENCTAAGPHFNPGNKTHGAPMNEERHAGDLGNIVADPYGIARIHIIDPMISLVAGKPSFIINRAIVVHAKEDDLGKGDNEESKKTGNAGDRLACCVIEQVVYYKK